ncbi:MAG: cyclic nucleotide-gated ion channel [Alphaproteobacteria bacterium]
MHAVTRLRRKLFLALEATPGSGHRQAWLSQIIVLAIGLSVIGLILSTVDSIEAEYGYWLDLLERGAVILFGFEYLARLWVAPEHHDPRFHHPFLGRLRWMLTPMALIDLAAILPPTSVIKSEGGDWLFLRLLRLARLLKITRYSRALATLGVVLYAERRSWAAAMFVMGIMLIFSSTIMWLLERDAQPDIFSSIPATMWWGVVTLTTVGYGDVYPITVPGRIFGGLCAVIGIGMFTLPAAILAEGFTRELRRRDFIVSFSMVANVPMFRELKPALLADIASHLSPQLLPARYTVVQAEEVPDALYFIVEGEVEAEYEHRRIVLGEGDFFGQEALFTALGEETESPAHVSTLTECKLMRLESSEFDWLMRHHPTALDALRIETGKGDIGKGAEG